MDCHLEFLSQVGDYLDGRRDNLEICDHRHCRIGEWLDAELAARANHRNPRLKKLQRIHREFHECCEDAVALARTGMFTAARSRLSEAYRHCGQMTRILSAYQFTFY